MKKILLLLTFFCISLLANAQVTCNQTFTAAGQDDGPTVLTINATDLTCNGGNPITSLQLINAADSLTSGFCTTNGTSWFGFSLSIDGGAATPVCDGEINGTDITGFTTLTITSQDNDAFSDGITITIDVEVTFTPTTPPNCDANLVTPADGDTAAPIDGNLTWSAATGGPEGYNLTVGTTPGGNDVLATTDVGNVLTYALGTLNQTTQYYVTIEPYNVNGPATGCVEQTFTTYTPIPGDVCGIAIPINCGDSVTGSTTAATDTDEPAGFCGTGGGAPGVWYTLTGNGDIVTASLCNSGYDTKIQVYEGACGALTCVSGNDDACGLQSETVFISNPGTEYYIYVFGFGTSTGNYQLDLTCVTPPPPPPNDDCADAINLTVNPDLDCAVITAGTIAGATGSADANPCFGTADDDIWYTFTATANLHTVSLLNIAGSTTDLYIGVYEGTCGALTDVLCSDNEEATVTGLTPGTTYTVRIYSWTGNPLQDSTFDICVGTPPPPIVTDITTYTEEQLVTEVLISGDCAVVDNIAFSSHSNDDQTGISYFTDGGSDFPFEDGVILSSGAATDAEGPFPGNGPSGPAFPNGGPGDADLEAITGVTNTNDATFLEFDFVPIAPQISFNYIMASSEYNQNFECTFADAFAFILTDLTTGAVSNLAVLPTSDTGDFSVLVTNIRPEVPGAFGCAAANEIYFGGYTPASGEIAYGGRTVPLTAFSPVTPGNTYHIKLVMADQGDSALDTAIFIEGGSFALGNLDLGDDVFLGDPAALCEGDVTTLNAGVLPNGTFITWYKDGEEITGATQVNPATGETEQILNIDVTGDYQAVITFTGTTCSVENTVHIEFYPNPAPDLGEDLFKCINEELLIDANVVNANDPNMGPLTYAFYLTAPGTTTPVLIQTGPSSTYLIDDQMGEEGLFSVIVTDDVTGCSGTSTKTILLYENQYCVNLPTGLSPNGDGVNDCLLFDNLEDIDGISKLQVFNRYGTKVYENGDYVMEWCGTNDDGDALITGTYYYILEFDDGREPLKSWIYLNTEE